MGGSGGHVQQGGAAAMATSGLYDVGPAGADAGDAVMARWLQSARLQHLASPLTSVDQRVLPSLLVQGYGGQSVEEKQKLHKLMRNLNFNGESGSEPYIPTSHSLAALESFYSPELRGEFGAGLLDLHAMDDTELLSEHVISELFEPSPFVLAAEVDNGFDSMVNMQQKGLMDTNIRSSTNEKEASTKESNVAKIKVVVRKRPLNKKEIARKEDDIVTVHDSSYLTVHEPKLKVDLTAYVEKHEFCFDAVLDQHVSNDEVYRVTVEPIIPTIFQQTKATCIAYGQTGSGKTFTMQPLPLRASEDIVKLLHQPFYRNQRFKLWLSYFEIYGGKLFDLLSDRRKLLMREDGRQQVCIVGLQEFEVSNVHIVREFIEKGNAARSTGSTGANEESSRSHAILQLAIKKHNVVKDSKKHNETSVVKNGKVVGKISFIDLAGSERGADTTDNDRQTRFEGAEINKSLLALKECIRALDNDQIHIPFRGSKLTEVLRDSFVGNSRTVMISCISPNAGSCEHTLNTLRYADRVKSLSKGGNSKKDQPPALGKDSSDGPSFPVSVEANIYDQEQEAKITNMNRKSPDSNSYAELERHPSSMILCSVASGRVGRGLTPSFVESEGVDMKNISSGFTSQKVHSSTYNSPHTHDVDKVQVSPPRRKGLREENPEKLSKCTSSNLSSISWRQSEQEITCQDKDINAILEEEDALIAAHRKEIENTMEIVREEMRLLEEVEQPGSLIDKYVSQLSFVLSRKAAGLVSLEARLARFQHRLKEQEILSRKKVPR